MYVLEATATQTWVIFEPTPLTRVPKLPIPSFQFTRVMGTNKSDKITCSPTLPDTDGEGGDTEWPVHSEDMDIFGISRSIIKWHHG